MPSALPKLILLDRDGVLNHDSDEYIKNPGEFVMIDGAAEAVAQLNTAGIRTCLVTNQSAVGRGMITVQMLEQIHTKMLDALAHAGARLDHILIAPDAPGPSPEATPRRKPEPGMIYEALERFSCPPASALMIGDSARDLIAAQKAGVPRALVRTGKGARTLAKGLPSSLLPYSVYNSLADAVQQLLGEAGHTG